MVSNSLTDRRLGSGLVRLLRFAMLIVCPNCATSYQVERSSLGPGGRSVRCARCSNIWFAVAPSVVPALASLDDLDVVDTGPKVPVFDAPPPAEEPPAMEAESPASAEPAPEFEESDAAPEQTPELAAEPQEPLMEVAAPETATEPEPEAGSTDGIDLDGLRADMDAAGAEQAADADAVLAEVSAGEIATTDAPSLVPAMEPAAAPEPRPTPSDTDARADIEAFAVRKARREAQRRRNRQWLVPGLPTIILALVAANMILVAWRMDVVRLLPQTASLYAAIGLPVNLRGLAFEDIRMSKEEQDGLTVLVVEGSIVNITGRAVEVPRLRLAVRNARKNEIYSWTTLPTRSVLGPGETLPFRSRLASPPAETREVLVRFFNKSDLVAGLR